MKVKVMSYKLWVMSLIILLSQFSILHSQSRCYAQPVSSIELINNAKLYDGKTVTYEGEVIG